VIKTTNNSFPTFKKICKVEIERFRHGKFEPLGVNIMGKPEFLEKMFKVHSMDLKDVKPECDGFFICPICGRKIPQQGIKLKLLSDAHIWPKDIREKNKKLISYRVLLCTQCNNTAGSFGDAQMGILESVIEGEKTGVLYGEREIQVITTPGEKPIKLKASVKFQKDELTASITRETNKNKGGLGLSPLDQQRFEKVIISDNKISMIILPPKNLKPELFQPGWFTAAYLMAFYHFGYRYILNPKLNPVRNFINNSFDKKAVKTLPLPNDNDFQIRKYHENNFSEPELNIVLPIDEGTNGYLEVNFLQYQIRLPFPFSPKIMDAFIYTKIPDFDERKHTLLGQNIYIPVHCTKMRPHNCVFDYLLGKPIPIVEDE
jgi:hypothetical protein